MAGQTVMINRAPVLTLWGAVVAERMGYDWEAALTFGKAMAGLNAQAKGRSLGIFGPPKTVERDGTPKKRGMGEEFWVEVCGRPVPAKNTDDGPRSTRPRSRSTWRASSRTISRPWPRRCENWQTPLSPRSCRMKRTGSTSAFDPRFRRARRAGAARAS